jgi:hypothetical protein
MWSIIHCNGATIKNISVYPNPTLNEILSKTDKTWTCCCIIVSSHICWINFETDKVSFLENNNIMFYKLYSEKKIFFYLPTYPYLNLWVGFDLFAYPFSALTRQQLKTENNKLDIYTQYLMKSTFETIWLFFHRPVGLVELIGWYFYHHVGFKKGRDLGEAGLTLEGEVVTMWRLTSISRWSKVKRISEILKRTCLPTHFLHWLGSNWKRRTII